MIHAALNIFLIPLMNHLQILLHRLNTSASATTSPSNETKSLWADCRLDENGIPDENGDNIKTGENATITREDIAKFADANKYCDMFADVDCSSKV